MLGERVRLPSSLSANLPANLNGESKWRVLVADWSVGEMEDWRERWVRQQHESPLMTVVDLIVCVDFTLALESRRQ